MSTKEFLEKEGYEIEGLYKMSGKEIARIVQQHGSSSTLETLVQNVEKWADNKGILKQENQLKQFTKVVEEVGEVAEGLAKGNTDMLKDGIGDTVVTLIILAKQSGMDITECLQVAWDEIKDRTGETVNGVFIKDK
jgi:NTP pyrophosphatase (non-canonical NTP hydrolase)